MKLDQVLPSQEQMAALMAYPKNQPLVMVNIIRFKTMVDGNSETGQEAYARYSRNVMPLIGNAKARLLWRGTVAQTVIGDSDQQPHLIFMVEYPSIDHFLSMIQSPAYREIAKDRTIALEYGGLLACQPT